MAVPWEKLKPVSTPGHSSTPKKKNLSEITFCKLPGLGLVFQWALPPPPGKDWIGRIRFFYHPNIIYTQYIITLHRRVPWYWFACLVRPQACIFCSFRGTTWQRPSFFLLNYFLPLLHLLHYVEGFHHCCEKNREKEGKRKQEWGKKLSSSTSSLIAISQTHIHIVRLWTKIASATFNALLIFGWSPSHLFEGFC